MMQHWDVRGTVKEGFMGTQATEPSGLDTANDHGLCLRRAGEISVVNTPLMCCFVSRATEPSCVTHCFIFLASNACADLKFYPLELVWVLLLYCEVIAKYRMNKSYVHCEDQRR